MTLCLGLTPTVQRTQRFASLTLGEVNRATETLTTASGKAVNVARVLDTLGARVCLIQPLGGDSGRYVHKSLPFSQEIVWVEDDAPTRTCCTLLSGAQTTELVEEAPSLSEADLERLFAAVVRQLVGEHLLILSGSLPPGTPPDFYARLCAVSSVPVVLDAQKEPLRLALAERPYLVKPNRQETIAALGLPPDTSALACAQALCAAGAQNALVSEGKAGAVLLTPQRAWRIVPPELAPVNPIGSGDSLLAGLVFSHFVGRQTLVEGACYGTACAAANCLTATSGVIEPTTANQLRPQVVLKPVQ
ncbi:1-phosphofructokinase family hexose kinase [Armatimonas rosea]|uniref:1-phosphofructokinase family hexose kinase n=1 Tax=Armatimonas rosea TaxID=685828 RepID=A0A7W9W5W8_ARMRO|nr:PfkB family carbohydrate kinase [Armatimonas rosea]MBB6050869.1 1-phosphofructokinase family hexose kinase [Armatimonas rosea]